MIVFTLSVGSATSINKTQFFIVFIKLLYFPSALSWDIQKKSNDVVIDIDMNFNAKRDH